MEAESISPDRLVTLYSELGQAIAGQVDTFGALGAITGGAVRAVPGADYASITRLRRGVYATLAATDPAADLADRIQYELGTGPCLDATVQSAVVLSADLGADPRWASYGARVVAETGINSVLSIRLVVDDDDIVAAINIYSLSLDAFAPSALTVATLMATHGGMALSAVIARERTANLTRALDTNREIGLAMGVLMTSLKVTREQAFELLRIASQHGNRKLFDVARDVADTGMIDLPQT